MPRRCLATLLSVIGLTASACSDDGGIVWSTTFPTTPSTVETASSTTSTTSTTGPVDTTTTDPTTTTAIDLPGIGDPYFPELGNPGYDVEHYLIDLVVDPVANTLAGEVVITAAATADLDRFHLALLGLTVDAVTVDGGDAGVARQDAEL